MTDSTLEDLFDTPEIAELRRMSPEQRRALFKAVSDTDTNYRAAHFIETYTGRAFYPLDPKVEAVSIIDIAHHLSNQCRYSGATAWLYSTAQHCCLLADLVQKQGGTALDCLQILMHDAPEAYLIDMPRPVKQFMPQFRVWDKNINVVIRAWMGWQDLPIPTWQDDIDSRIIVDERAQVMSDSGLDWGHDIQPLGVEIDFWPPTVAEQQFLMRYASYSRQVYGSHQYLRSSWGLPTACNYTQDFKTRGSDRTQFGESNPSLIVDLQEVDIRGGVGRVAMRSPDGMMVRDTKAGRFPMPAWKWVHGKFEFASPDIEKVKVELQA